MLKSPPMRELDVSPDHVVDRLVGRGSERGTVILDSCGLSKSGSEMLLAGIQPTGKKELRTTDREYALNTLDKLLTGRRPVVFTLSYDLGRKLAGIRAEDDSALEPDVFAYEFDALIIHDYSTGKTALHGNEDRFSSIDALLSSPSTVDRVVQTGPAHQAFSNFTAAGYKQAIATIQNHIREGNTYQTNLTQQFTVDSRDRLVPADVFRRLKRDHPASYAAFIHRGDSTVVSASPERFFRMQGDRISTSPIKGTRRRGRDEREDAELRAALLGSEKDRAENTMITDLLRNDLGRICEFGSVVVDAHCEIEEHPTLFHLSSTITGRLRTATSPSEILRALFPCGSITGAPKRSTMRIIDEIEPDPRGLSMGSIGYYFPAGFVSAEPIIDTSVAIRTMVFSCGKAVFNTGGGVVIDSDAAAEYDESLLKAKALLAACHAEFVSG